MSEATTVTIENIDQIIRNVKREIQEANKNQPLNSMYAVWDNRPERRINYKTYRMRGRPKKSDYIEIGLFDYLVGEYHMPHKHKKGKKKGY